MGTAMAQIPPLSPHAEHRPKILNHSFLKLTANYPKWLMSLLINLRTNHIALNKHLHRIGKSDSPHCTHCPQTPETMHHFLFECPKYNQECHILVNQLGRSTTSLPFLLTTGSPIAIPCLVKYVNATDRLSKTYGKVTSP